MFELKVAFIIPAIDGSGPAVFLGYLVQGLIDVNCDVDVFYFKGEDNFKINVKKTKINYKDSVDFSRYDIVSTIGALPCMYAAKNVERRKWFAEMVNLFEQDFRMLYKFPEAQIKSFLFKKSLSECDNIIVSSEAMKDYYSRMFPSKRYYIIPHGIPDRPYTDILDKDKQAILSFKSKGLVVIGSVGVLVRRKGFSQLLPIVEKNQDIALVIVGDGEEGDNLKTECTRRGILDRVLFTGRREDSFNYNKYFDIYAHVSYSEGFGMAFLEAMSKGVPIVCSRLDIYKGFLTDDDVCYFTPDNESELTEAISLAIKERDYYSNKSKNVFESLFALKRMAEQHVLCYKGD